MLAYNRRTELSASTEAVPTLGRACVQAPLLAHALLHHPRAWPRQETALGLLISLRKFYQTVGVRLLLAGSAGRLCCCQPTTFECPDTTVRLIPDLFLSPHCPIGLLCCAGSPRR